ncbi:MAG: response regulator [Ferruginibacter sp.]
MNFFNVLSIKQKLIIASLIPLLALFYYLQINVRRELKNKASVEQALENVAQIQQISKVVHEFQKERALMLTFLASNGAIGKDQLLSQAEATDRANSGLSKLLKDQGITIHNYATLDSLPTVRANVFALKAVGTIDPFYADFKESLLTEVSLILRSSQNLELKNSFEEHLSLLYAKDYLAQARSLLGAAITQKKFEGIEYGEFASIRGKHEMNLRKFQNIASPQLKEFFDKKYQTPFVQQTYTIINDAFNRASLDNFAYDFDTWWAAATASINSLKDVEDFSSELTSNKANDELAITNSNVTQSIVVAVVMMILIFGIVWLTIKSIIDGISSIKKAADSMAKGEVGVALHIKTKDEIGELAASFNKMVSVTKDFSQIADKIGKGDYTPAVTIRSEKDTLGIALDTMKTNLQNLSKDNEIRTWLLTGNSELNNRIRGEKTINELAQDVITQLTTYLNAQVGAIYLYDNEELTLVGSYAFTHRKENTSSFKLGQGLVGQAALEKKTILFSQVPDDYIRINSGLGHTVPKNIVVFPFLYDGEVKGVMEIGAVKEFSDLDIEFLNIVGENIAISFNAAQSRNQMKELLGETQRQAEELETQQEELRQSNEELTEKTDLLERSEAELKTQQEELQQTNEELEEKANLLEDQKGKLENAKMDIENKARELEVTNKYKSEFLANMSHELRTPLNSILILSQLLSENKNKNLAEKEVEFAKNVYNSGADLLQLINEILDLSKVESGRMELDITDVPFSEINTEINSMFSEVAKNKAIDFAQHTNENSIKSITTDKQRLEQILRNLLSNAFKFTGKGGKVTFSIHKEDGNVSFKNPKLQSVRDIIAFLVTDNGIGIPRDKLGVVFEAFQQADGSTKRKYGGTGLGLSISRELANALGGEIQVKSIEGTGSTFTLFLPVQFDSSIMTPVAHKVEVKEKFVPAPNGVQKFTIGDGEVNDDRYSIQENDKVILVMEDDLEFSKILLDFVRERNYKGIVAAQGNTGLSYARHYKPDAILLDMKLPVMDGAEVLKHLKNDPDLRHIPVQVISGYDRRKEGLELGAFDFIRKPIGKTELGNAFERIEDFVSKKLKKLLIVEDNVTQNKAIRELIGNGDVRSFSAFTGEEAYEMLSKEKYDCLIVDLGLPDMSGFNLLEKIKTNDNFNKIPIVVYTGKDLSKDENAKLMKFANTVVLKTVNSQERLLDETMLFLHRVESKLPADKQNIIRQLHKTGEVLKNKNVLVVDDDIRNIYSITNALEEEGMNCITAENGKVAVNIVKENPNIDIVLMDVMMPEMDGYDATKEIRSISKFSKLPVIALTAKAMKGDREKCLSVGMSDYIAKPVNIEQLLSLMRVWLYR